MTAATAQSGLISSLYSIQFIRDHFDGVSGVCDWYTVIIIICDGGVACISSIGWVSPGVNG